MDLNYLLNPPNFYKKIFLVEKKCKISRWRDSNPRPADYKSAAQPG